ncbi:MAG: polysaccharide deacetylase family protein [Euryarchaeota archaeon]|nr:polysaccharide deacetylase family protein [Euryarchaeota archaeon]
MQMKNALTIDLEYWHSPELIRGFLPEKRDDLIIKMTMPILRLLDEFGVSATFFVLGAVAAKYPELVAEIHSRGHEIASHAYSHRTLHELGRGGFEDEIDRSVRLLREITGESPIGFRAPSFSIDNATGWAFDVLARHGFKYDSSIFPVETHLYGVQDAPLVIYRPSAENVVDNDPNGKIIEFPLTILEYVRKVPISGGFYLRVLPFSVLKRMIGIVNKERPAVIYLHPWEIVPMMPRLKLPMQSRFITYHGIKSARAKLEGLLVSFSFAPVREVLGL